MLARFFRFLPLFGAVAFLSGLLSGLGALAQNSVGEKPGGHLKITEVAVDFVNDTLVITGESFDFNRCRSCSAIRALWVIYRTTASPTSRWILRRSIVI